MVTYRQFYKNVLGFEPYGFQQKVAELLLEGKNVILSVPTGAGKTWASIMPFLYATCLGKKDFPQKLIYSLPLRTLANSIYNDVNEVLSSNQVYEKEFLTSIQTGEYNNDPYFENDIVFSTIDQTLSNFLCFPLSLSHNQANINAGAIIGSYLVFDEFHLLDSKLSMRTTIGMLRLLNKLCRVCIMTATLTDGYIQFLQKKALTNFEVISIKDFPEDIKQIKSLIPASDKAIKKSVHVCNSCLNAQQILEKHKNKTIVICNRVETAQRLFLELETYKNRGTKLLCIHSRFFDKDRKRKEVEIKEWFGKGSTYRDVILVSTQVIEAGMDISSDVMFTEISPINSLLQRAGRCARFANEYGDVYICDVLNLEEKEILDIDNKNEDEIKRLKSRYLPYHKDLCVKSLEALKEFSYIDEAISVELVNMVLQEDEMRKSNEIQGGLYNLDKIRNAWHDCDKRHYTETIRDIQSIEVVLLDMNNCQNQRFFPWEYEAISVYRWSFIGWIKRIIQTQEDSDEWIVAKAEQSSDSSFDFEWEDRKIWYLRKLSFDELKNYYDIVFINNRYFDYNEAGLFVANNSNGKISPLKNHLEQETENITYKKDTFYQHNKALLNCYEMLFSSKMDFTFNQMSAYWGKTIDWDKWIKIMICFHDFGKLNNVWQKPMLAFQRKKMANDLYYEVLAHTDYDESVDVELAMLCKIRNKPPHAGIGATQIYDLFNKDDDEIARAAACAIMKHHSVDTESVEVYEISRKYLTDLSRLLKELSIKCPSFNLKGRKESLKDIVPEKDKEWLTYLFFVRILRLCDQKATALIEKYYQL